MCVSAKGPELLNPFFRKPENFSEARHSAAAIEDLPGAAGPGGCDLGSMSRFSLCLPCPRSSASDTRCRRSSRPNRMIVRVNFGFHGHILKQLRLSGG